MTEPDTITKQILLSKPQFQLVSSKVKFPAFVGGLGSGKTEALIQRAMYLKNEYPTGNIGYYLPTFDLVALIAMPRFEEKLEEMQSEGNGLPFKCIKSPRPRIDIENCGSIIFRTMDTPGRIIGYEVMDSMVDEIDTLKLKAAKDVWRKILSRNRQKKPDGKPNTVAVGTTPEGFEFVYETWKKEEATARTKGYFLIKASTYSNQKNLPADYIGDLIGNFPSNLIEAYIEGNFVNLKSGSVYPDFDRVLNNSVETIKPTDDLNVGMDFNVTKMAAIIIVNRDGLPHAVTELTGIYDTPAIIKAIKLRFPNHRIFVYPDSSGGSRKTTDASESDIQLLRQAGFHVFAPAANPPVRDRVLAMNVMILNGEDQRRFKVNVNACPILTEGLEKQSYDDNGEPDKTSGLDHLLDATGYYIHYNWPVKGRAASRLKMVGM